jgi:hypothetical protein
MSDRLYEAESTPEPTSYERRGVLFCDILGWRDQIAEAESDSQLIGRLRRTILRPIQTLRQGKTWGHDYKFSSFSDNIVISCPPDLQNVGYLAFNTASFVSATVRSGFLIRGGLTIGDIVHDEHVVFGPALNRAYELESKHASVPRIILDPAIPDEFPSEIKICMAEEHGCRFIDPFSYVFMGVLAKLMKTVPEETWKQAGFKSGVELGQYEPSDMLQQALSGLKPMIKRPLPDKEFGKVSWLYDRIAKQLGVPPMSSYPRVRPANMVVHRD